MNLVWETLLPAMKEKALPADAQKLAQLSQKRASLSLQPVKGAMSSPISKKLANKTFTLSENSCGIKSINFDLDKGLHRITMNMEKGSETIQVGSDTYIKGKMVLQLPFTDNLLPAVASSGAWTDPDTYELRIYFYEMPERITYTFHFENEDLTWESKLEHSLFGPRTQEQLYGKWGDN
jgi:hypothetical protein